MLTTIQFKTLDDLYNFYNEKLFEASLPECIVNLSRKANTSGFFAPNIWASADEPVTRTMRTVHELSLNPDHLLRPSINWHSTLVHEMVHLWEYEQGKPSRLCYHNKIWANKMMAIGLMPTDTGEPGGKITGQRMRHYILENGLFERVFHSLDPEELERLRLKYLPIASLSGGNKKGDEPEDGADGGGDGKEGKKKSKKGVRMKYTCDCGNNIWGKSGLKIRCLECEGEYKEV